MQQVNYHYIEVPFTFELRWGAPRPITHIDYFLHRELSKQQLAIKGLICFLN